MLIYSFEKDKIIEDLKLPDHMVAVELGDLMIYCTSCSEGKFIQSYGDKIYQKLTEEFHKTEFKIDDPEYEKFTDKISKHFCDKLKDFIDRHKGCPRLSLEETLHSCYCLQ